MSVHYIEDRYKCYKMNIIYTSVFEFCYNVIYLQCLMCFGAGTEIFSVLLVQVLLCLKNHAVLVTTIKSAVLYYLTRTEQLRNNGGQPIVVSKTVIML